LHLDGIHHITGITGDGQRCVDFYAGILGLSYEGRARDFEAPGSHLIRLGGNPDRPGGTLSFIEAPGIGQGRAGNGMVHAVSWAVRSPAAIAYWSERLSAAGIDASPTEPPGGRPQLRFSDPEGLEHLLSVEPSDHPVALAPSSAGVSREHAIVRLRGVRAFGREHIPSADVLAGRLGFRVTGADSYAVGADELGSGFAFDPPPPSRARLGAGTIHHVAWASDGELPAWRQRVIGMGCRATPVVDRGHCRSIYFREPSGVLFEIATHGQDIAATASQAALERLSPRVDPRLHAAFVG
jgi:glyoxalase family protein